MKKFNWMDIASLAICFLPLVYLYFIYPGLPQTIPTHFGANGMPNAYGHRTEIITITGVFSGMSVLLYLLLKFLPAIDPKKKVKFGEETFRKLALGLVMFFAALSVVIIYSIAHKGVQINKLLLPLVGLLLAFVGNMMYNIKPNYFAGVRTPWTLEDDNTWRATHRVAGKLWFTGGIILAALMLIINGNAAIIVFMSIVAILVLVPVIFSYIYFKSHQADNNGVTK